VVAIVQRWLLERFLRGVWLHLLGHSSRRRRLIGPAALAGEGAMEGHGRRMRLRSCRVMPTSTAAAAAAPTAAATSATASV
jgi:hypothetical protein